MRERQCISNESLFSFTTSASNSFVVIDLPRDFEVVLNSRMSRFWLWDFVLNFLCISRICFAWKIIKRLVKAWMSVAKAKILKKEKRLEKRHSRLLSFFETFFYSQNLFAIAVVLQDSSLDDFWAKANSWIIKRNSHLWMS